MSPLDRAANRMFTRIFGDITKMSREERRDVSLLAYGWGTVSLMLALLWAGARIINSYSVQATRRVEAATGEVAKATAQVELQVGELARETSKAQLLAVRVGVVTAILGAILGGFAGAFAAKLIG